MVASKTIETLVGAFMIAAIVALAFLAVNVSGLTVADLKDYGGYDIRANFDNIGGLKVRAPVTMAGVKIGEVASIQLDQSEFKASVTMHILPSQPPLPKDTSAQILTAGLLGANYIGLTPGFEDTVLGNQDTLETTHSALVLEDLIGQLLFKIKKEKQSP